MFELLQGHTMLVQEQFKNKNNTGHIILWSATATKCPISGLVHVVHASRYICFISDIYPLDDRVFMAFSAIFGVLLPERDFDSSLSAFLEITDKFKILAGVQ